MPQLPAAAAPDKPVNEEDNSLCRQRDLALSRPGWVRVFCWAKVLEGPRGRGRAGAAVHERLCGRGVALAIDVDLGLGVGVAHSLLGCERADVSDGRRRRACSR